MGQPAQQTEQTLIGTADLASATVTDLLTSCPQTVPVFLRHRLACVGCSLSRFETIMDVAAIYGLDLDCFLQELRQAVTGQVSYARNGRVENEGKAK